MIRLSALLLSTVLLAGCGSVAKVYNDNRDLIKAAVKTKTGDRVHDECIDEVLKIIGEELGAIEEAEETE